jgi:hypothetical protein
MKVKFCPRCKLWKLITEFYKCASRPDGVQSYCKPCWNKYAHNRVKNNKVKVSNREHIRNIRDIVFYTMIIWFTLGVVGTVIDSRFLAIWGFLLSIASAVALSVLTNEIIRKKEVRNG